MWLSAVMKKLDPDQRDIVTVSDRNLALKIAVGLNEELRYILLQVLCTCYAPLNSKVIIQTHEIAMRG
jgi:hypothetical protein